MNWCRAGTGVESRDWSVLENGFHEEEISFHVEENEFRLEE